MDVKAIRQLNDQELRQSIDEYKEALYKLRFQKAAGQLEDLTAIRKTQRIVARLKTIQRERQIASQNAEGK